MVFIRTLIVLLFIVFNLNAQMQEDVVFVENKDSNEISLKEEFLNNDTKLYTITIGTLTLQKHDPIEFFKTNKLTNAVAYKFGDKKEFARVISGVFKTEIEAKEHIKSLSSTLQKNKPYSSKITRHQRLFSEYNGLIKKEKKLNLKNESKVKKTINLRETNGSIFIGDSLFTQQLKDQFLNKESKYYSIALGSISLKKNSIKNFFNAYDVEDKALAHLYGKKKDKVRIIYGLYKTREEAKEAISRFSERLKENSPYPMKMKKFQSFYSKSFPNEEMNNSIVELKVNDSKKKEQQVKAKLSDEIKVVENIKAQKIEKTVIKEKEIKKEVLKKSRKLKK